MLRAIALSDLARMREQLFFDGPDRGKKLSRFWALLVLAAIIASSAGALLLFLTNVAAILLSGIVVMALYRVRSAAGRADSRSMRDRASVVLVVAFVLVIAVPLLASSGRIAQVTLTADTVSEVAGAWAQPAGWTIERVDQHLSEMVVRAAGPLPAPDSDQLRRDLDAAGLQDVDVRLVLRPEQTLELTSR